MDKTLGTIRSEIEKNKEGIIPDVTLVIDTNILADHAWSRDSNVTYLIDGIVPEHPEFLIVVPQICKVEFKLITKEEVNAWKTLQQEMIKKIKDLQRYDGFEELYNGLKENVIEILSNLMFFFSQSLPEQYEIAYYISKDPEYGLLFDDALIFSFAKLVGKSLESDSKVLFLTKDRDFEVGKVIKELEESNVEVYFNSNECIQRINGLLA
jgi:predicted nucleic acid-binding protein